MEESVGGGLDRQLGVEVAGRQGAGGVKGGAVTHRHQLRQSGPTGGAVHYYRPYRANSLLTTGGQLLGGNQPPLPPCALKLADFQWFTISFFALRL